jgi:hypothetical protein
MSTSKRQRLDAFLTPLKKTTGNSQGGRTTPGSVSKLQFSTPAFLKRNPLPVVGENGTYTSPQKSTRLPRKPLVRGLSAIVASLRKVEEEALDEDLEALREMEGAEAATTSTNKNTNSDPSAIPSAGPKTTVSKPTPAEEDILVADSQGRQLLLGGFDDEGLYDSPNEEQQLDRGQPLKVYKKKGQKRTTRRVNMKPVRFKRPTEQPAGDNSPDDDEEQDHAEGAKGGIVPETQLNSVNMDGPDDDFLGSDTELDGSDIETVLKAAEGATSTKAKGKPKGNRKKRDMAKDETGKKEGPVKRAVKVSATAHANFRRLKLRNTGVKGGPGHNSRFRRRR